MNIYTILSIIITEIIIIINLSQLTKKKIPIKFKTLGMLIILILVTIMNNTLIPIHLKFSVGLLMTFIASKVIFTLNIKDSFSIALLHSITYVILELILSPLLMINNIHTFIISTINCLFSIIIGGISILLFKNKYIYNYFNKLKRIISDNINSKIIFVIILLFINYLVVTRALKTNDINIILISLISVCFILIMLKSIVNDKYNINILNERNNNLKDSYKAYSKTIDDCKEFKHNLKNELYSIKTLLPKEHQEKLNLIVKKYNTNYEWIDKIDEIPDGLQGLIYLKKKEALNKKINIVINTTGKIEANSIDYIDLSNIIGILLDNAIEASVKTKAKIIEVLINNTKNGINIEIINKYNNAIDLTKIGKKNYSTKVYKSGIGLNYINNIKNSHIKIDYKIINDLFKTTIYYSK